MDQHRNSFDWDRAKAFYVTAKEGSFSGAARNLGLTQPTVGRQITALEQELGVVLIERAARGIDLTSAGLDLLEQIRPMAEAADKVLLTASGQAQELKGVVRISATEVACAFLFPELLTKFRRMHPAVEIELISTNSLSDLRKREADIALRGLRPTDPELFARRVFQDAAVLFASRRYLSEFGEPSNLDELANASFIGSTDNEQVIGWLNSAGAPISSANFVASCSSHLIQWQLVKSGMGILPMPAFVGETDPDIQQVLPSLPAFEFELWLVAHRELKTSRRLRLVYDFLVNEIGSFAMSRKSTEPIRPNPA